MGYKFCKVTTRACSQPSAHSSQLSGEAHTRFLGSNLVVIASRLLLCQHSLSIPFCFPAKMPVCFKCLNSGLVDHLESPSSPSILLSVEFCSLTKISLLLEKVTRPYNTGFFNTCSMGSLTLNNSNNLVPHLCQLSLTWILPTSYG